MKALTYSRVSTANKDQNPQVQVLELRRYCEARGWPIVEELIDHGYSGSTDVRPGLKRLLELARGREVDVIVVIKMDRLFRSLKHLVTTLDEFQALGVQFIATKDNVDYTTPGGRLFVQVLGCLAEFEKGLLRERTLLGLQHARSIGKILGRPKKRNDTAIQSLREQGLSYTAIQRQLGISRSAVCRSLKASSKTPLKADLKT